MITFRAYQDLRVALEQGRRDVEAWWSAHRGQSAAEWAGDNVKEMMRDREATIRFLQSPNASVRLAAISLVADYWPGNERFAAETLRLAFEDPEPAIRGAALAALLVLRQYIADPTGFLRRLLSELFPGLRQEVVADILRDLSEEDARFKEMMRKMWQDAAGPHAPQMLESRPSAESYLTHPEPDVRRAALMVLKDHWKPNKEFGELCEKLLFEDPDLKVRSLALVSLAGYYIHTDNKRIGALVARLVYDDSNPLDLRVTAYQALFTIRGMPGEAFLDAASANFRFPEHVDWSFVESFLQ